MAEQREGWGMIKLLLDTLIAALTLNVINQLIIKIAK